jgi:hypothetical protein
MCVAAEELGGVLKLRMLGGERRTVDGWDRAALSLRLLLVEKLWSMLMALHAGGDGCACVKLQCMLLVGAVVILVLCVCSCTVIFHIFMFGIACVHSRACQLSATSWCVSNL